VELSVNDAPPALPVYVQPPCPQPNLIWTPGYWHHGFLGYYWVPGAWVPAPYVGALWTPGYWGFAGGGYGFHAGYWGPHIGFYGGVNYGGGYMGIGFAGGSWNGGTFAYNTAVVNVNRTSGDQRLRQHNDRQTDDNRESRQTSPIVVDPTASSISQRPRSKPQRTSSILHRRRSSSNM
jgi:hypothetical protein